MEYYIFYCGRCPARYHFMGNKSCWTKQQSEERDKLEHICRVCKYDDRTGDTPKHKIELDMGENPATLGTSMVVGILGSFLGGEKDPEKMLDAGEKALRDKEAEFEKQRHKPLITHGLFSGFSVIFVCDRKCEKAWGHNSRPRNGVLDCSMENIILMTNAGITDGDDFQEALADGELDEAPTYTGVSEGGHGKPMHPDKHNKWCVRECERCETHDPGEPLYVHNFAHRIPNLSTKYLAEHKPELVILIKEEEAEVNR